MIKRFIFEEEGQTLVEYALLIGLLAIVVVATVTIFGKRAFAFFNNANNEMP